MKKHSKDKKPYKPPKIESKEIYEVDALSCGKCVNAQQVSLGGGCLRGRTKKS